jgi:hypothetical protein
VPRGLGAASFVAGLLLVPLGLAVGWKGACGGSTAFTTGAWTYDNPCGPAPVLRLCALLAGSLLLLLLGRADGGSQR